MTVERRLGHLESTTTELVKDVAVLQATSQTILEKQDHTITLLTTQAVQAEQINDLNQWRERVRRPIDDAAFGARLGRIALAISGATLIAVVLRAMGVIP